MAPAANTRPLLRSDLSCVREEQQGVVFYRIDDPDTQTSFRLYEIEYLIAQKLDGKRRLDDVINAVKADYNFDITRPDLEKFVSQLESMGFVRAEGAAAVALSPAAATAVTAVTSVTAVTEVGRRPTLEPGARPVEPEVLADDAVLSTDTVDVTSPGNRAPGRPPSKPTEKIFEQSTAELSPAADLVERTRPPVDEAELKRLLRSALLHVKQGYIVHARDYFLAARELDPGNPALQRLCGQLDLMSDGATAAEVSALWQDATQSFPEVAAEVGPLLEGEGIPQSLEESTVSEQNIGARLVWLFVLLIVLGGGSYGVWYALTKLHILQGTLSVTAVTLKGEKVAVYHDKPAARVEPVREAELGFDAPGKVASLAAAGDRVRAGEIIGMLELQPPVKKKLEQAQQAVKKAQETADKAQQALAQVAAEREAAQREHDEAEEELKKLRPESILKRGGVSKRDMEKFKRLVTKSNKKLSQLTKKERRPKTQEAQAKKRLETTKKQLEVLEKRLAGKLLRAPFDGEVISAKAEIGETVERGKPVLHVLDPLAARVIFILPAAGEAQTGGEVYVSIKRGEATSGKVVGVTEAAGGVEVGVELVDPGGGFRSLEPDAFRLVKRFVEPAFKVPEGAVHTSSAGNASILLVQQGRASRRDVEILERGTGVLIVRATGDNIQDGEKLVTKGEGVADLGAVVEGAEVEAP